MQQRTGSKSAVQANKKTTTPIQVWLGHNLNIFQHRLNMFLNLAGYCSRLEEPVLGKHLVSVTVGRLWLPTDEAQGPQKWGQIGSTSMATPNFLKPFAFSDLLFIVFLVASMAPLVKTYDICEQPELAYRKGLKGPMVLSRSFCVPGSTFVLFFS